MSCRSAPAGLVSGPRKLKIVRTPSSLRTGTTWRIAWWWWGANMKPKPHSSMQAATAAGSRSIRAPSASSTSAEPDRPVALRLPCLATAQPAPAATNAAVVETLNVGRPPPVPAVSSRSSRLASTATASSRIARARPTSSSTVSPFVRRAIRNAADWASEAAPDMISRRTAAASAAARSSPPATRSIASVRTGLGIQEVLQERLAAIGEHRLGVELHSLGGQLAVADRHHGAVRPGRALEAVRQVRIDDERVVAPGHERGFEAAEDRPAVVLDRCGLAVDRLAAHDPSPERLGQRLVAEADAQHGHADARQRGDRRHRHARLVRRARSRRYHRAVRRALDQLLDRGHVVAHHLGLRPQLAEVLDEVVGERVVVVEHQDAH